MPDEVLEFTHDGSKSGRIDKLVRDWAGGDLSRETIKKRIVAGHCRVDGAICPDPSRMIKPGQHIDVALPRGESLLEPEAGDVSVLWQDDHLLVINKPASLTTHPAPSCPQGTLAQRLLALRPELRAIPGWRPGIVHRLDKDTSGLILVAPGERARLALCRAFARREIDKTYLALVSGRMHPEEGECREPLGRDPVRKTRMAVVREKDGGRPAHTAWRTLYADPAGRFSLLAVRLHTGRTHQIRVHMAHAGHPLLGDATYAPKAIADLAPRQMLHAWKLHFIHPLSQAPCSFVCPPPSDFPATMLRLGRRADKIVITGLPGCGKSALTRLMAEAGYPIWSADDVVREAYEPGRDGGQCIHHRFRGRFTRAGQAVDKTALAAALRETPDLRAELETVIHPLVNASLADFWRRADDTEQSLAFAEVPLWLETGGSRARNRHLTVTVLGVRCPAAVRHDRIVRLRQWSAAMVAAADGWQWPEEKKMAACDALVDNSLDVDHLRAGGREFIRTRLEMRAEREAAQIAAWERLWEA
jgi:23S rRNA pseudouridine1911/1915/1917 synthase